jgi:DNA-binding SARP family transcriptional activator
MQRDVRTVCGPALRSYAAVVETTLGAAPPEPGEGTVGCEVAVLGAVEVRRDDGPVELGTPKQRAVVAALALAQGRPVSADALIDLLWHDVPPATATTTLQAYVSGLRKALEPGRRRRGASHVLVTVGAGYALRTSSSDAARFDRTVTTEHARLAFSLLDDVPLTDDALRGAVHRLDETLATWRGRPYAELGDAPAAVAERARLEELRAVALEDKAVARLALGEHARAAVELEALTSAYPLRERLWWLRALGLVRAGRQAEALEVLRDVRALLDEELGLDPGPDLRDLQQLILRQDPALDWRPPPKQGRGPAADRNPDRTPDDAPVVASGAPVRASDEWPMLGREDELARLEEALRQALAGRTACAVVTGEPGIGKSRLCSELASRARALGAQVLVGRCSQDDGAPPLWPWTTILERLGAAPPGPPDDSDLGGEFRVREAIVRAVREAAAAGPVVLLLDDLHWADTATLRVLRLLAESAHDDPLLVLGTWRDHPRPTGALADVAEALARLHAVRVELGGLGEPAVVGIVDAVTSRRPSPAQADALRRRTDGNPFFLIEYARLAGSRVELEQLLGEDDPPTAVQEVLARRLERLPDDTVEALRAAAVVGREFDLVLLAAATGTAEDHLVDRLEAARVAGLVREDGVDKFVFAHALVRDTIYTGLSASRRARRHARVATFLSGRAGRETEEARHWLAAGPAHAARAWRAAAIAADVAVRAHAHDEAADLLRTALTVVEDDPGADLRDRYDLLMQLVTAYRWAARWTDLTPTVERAIGVAEEMGDPVLAAEAAISTTQGALWQSAAHGEVHHGIVATLRRSLQELPAGDSTLRCRCMLSLANELYYATTHAERRALIDEAVAMARRLDDRALLVHACQSAFLGLWSPTTAEERLAYAEEAVALARAEGDDQAAVLSQVFRTIALGELGRVGSMWQSAAETRVAAERLRLAYPLLVLDSMMISWHALAGEFERGQQVFEGLLRTVSGASLKHADDAVAGAVVSLAIWEGRTQEAVDGVRAVVGGPLPVDSLLVHLLWRNGQEQEARAYHAEHPPALEDHDWFSLLNWCNAGAAALYTQDRDLAARVYTLLSPLCGMSCCAGSGNASGPVDGYLAMTAAAAGELELATRHADDAERLAEEWQVPLFTQWLREQRDRFGF